MWATVLARAGKEAEAREMVAEGEALRDLEPTSAGAIALVYVTLGELDEAFQWMERARAEYDSWLFQLQHPWWDPIRAEPRFAEFLKTINLPPAVGLEPPHWRFPSDWEGKLSTGG